ncbi:NAD(P)-binding domain-containing protein [Streptomyces olivaceus]|uniref:NAD(P)-binding domain-containing protein n=1 Tax=Streptomyces olivaceus TaxID=47716 RepID=A0ABS7W7N9_STROV|nr:NAD(P)-binding domain-containing protein [Streptomyces olivaceus]MBZ6098092.1 NAD(P)-binding domain-containing protein [Streptomyces olivaceus]MBZ6118629.1 NAD(P)-binding domain-containing protein [Streptomyces olivaceus]MBZ6153974.1 NAD(P)-binding domain-containing protein [Streptomyces olivaceus]MBZ6300057.1 NAD(P)-binding domain-containing protein [Streptomyces olivaceus]
MGTSPPERYHPPDAATRGDANGEEVSTPTLGVIGTGMVGREVARRAVDAGLDVVLSNSRGPGSLAGLVAELGTRARAATAAEAAGAGSLVVASVPLAARGQLPRAELSGKTVIDPMNYAPHSGFAIPELDSNELTSSELVQRHLANARVVKALHNIGPKQLAELFRPAGAPDRTALPLSGDDPDAKKEVAGLLDVLGFDTVDLGTLADSWRSEPNTPLYAAPYVGRPPSGLTAGEYVAWVQQAPGVPVPAARIAELSAAAVRGPAGFRM